MAGGSWPDRSTIGWLGGMAVAGLLGWSLAAQRHEPVGADISSLLTTTEAVTVPPRSTVRTVVVTVEPDPTTTIPDCPRWSDTVPPKYGLGRPCVLR